MIFDIILAIILFIALIIGIYVMYNTIVGIKINNNKLTVLCGIYVVLIIMLLGVVLCSILFNI